MEPGYVLAVCVGCFSMGLAEPVVAEQPTVKTAADLWVPSGTPKDYTQCFTGEIWKASLSRDQQTKSSRQEATILNQGIGSPCGGDFRVKPCPEGLVCAPKHSWRGGMGTSGTCQLPDRPVPSSALPAFPAPDSKLIPPIKGSPTLSFNEITHTGGKSKGLVWKSNPSAEVVSPAAGHIVYAGNFRDYGNLIIVNAASGYHLLMAGLSTLAVKPGDIVTAGALLGKSNPTIYFELRKDGQPINPEPWMYPSNVMERLAISVLRWLSNLSLFLQSLQARLSGI